MGIYSCVVEGLWGIIGAEGESSNWETSRK